MKKGIKSGSAILGLFIFMVLWQLLSWMINREIMPSPLIVLPIFFTDLPGDLGLHLLASAGRVLSAVCVAVLTAAPLGLLMGQAPRINRVLDPLIAIIYPIPKIVLLPVIYVLIGITDLSKILLIALIIFFQILVVVRDEAINLRPELILSVRSLCAGRRALFKYVYLPASLPAVLTALRVSVGTAIAVLFIAEQSLTTWGLGYYIVVETYQVLRYPQMYSGILAMGLLGVVLFFLLSSIERRINRHRYLDEN